MKYFAILFLFAIPMVLSVATSFAELNPSGIIIHVQTSSASYVVGDEVVLRIDTKPNSDVVVDVLNPSDEITEHFVAISDEYGQITTSFLLPYDTMQGIWKVKATYGSDFDAIEFDVKDRLVPEPEQDRQVSENCGPGTTLQDGMCVVDETEITVDPSHRWGAPYTFDVEPPLKQFKSGIAHDDIQCKKGLVNIIKISDGSPACVSLQTKEKLMQRDWATEPMFYGLTKMQITDIQHAKLGCTKTGNQTYCDEMVQDKIKYYLQQNKLDTKPESVYNPYETRCGSAGIPYIPENWQSLGLNPTDDTWENLGRHIIKQEFYEQLKQKDIIFKPACFGVYTGFALTSYPPNFSMCTMVTDLDGSKIYLEGSVREFDVTFFEMNKEIPYLCDENHHGCLCGIENEN